MFSFGMVLSAWVVVGFYIFTLPNKNIWSCTYLGKIPGITGPIKQTICLFYSALNRDRINVAIRWRIGNLKNTHVGDVWTILRLKLV